MTKVTTFTTNLQNRKALSLITEVAFSEVTTTTAYGFSSKELLVGMPMSKSAALKEVEKCLRPVLDSNWRKVVWDVETEVYN